MCHGDLAIGSSGHLEIAKQRRISASYWTTKLPTTEAEECVTGAQRGLGVATRGCRAEQCSAQAERCSALHGPNAMRPRASRKCQENKNLRYSKPGWRSHSWLCCAQAVSLHCGVVKNWLIFLVETADRRSGEVCHGGSGVAQPIRV